MKELSFSIVIPVCHGGEFLSRAMRSVTDLDYPAKCFELLVAVSRDDEQSLAAVEKVAAMAPFAVLPVRSRASMRARWLNEACAIAGGSILAFTDDDCVLPPDWLRRIAKVVKENTDLGAVGGGDELLGSVPFDHSLDWVLNSFVGSGGCRLGHGPRVGRFYPKLWNMALPRGVAAAVAVRGRNGREKIFDESLSTHEDVELMGRIERLGKKILFSPAIRVFHSRDTTFWSFLRRNFDMARTCRREGVHQLAHRFLAVSVMTFAFFAAAAVWWDRLRPLFFLMTLIYATLLAASAAAGALKKKSPAVFPYVTAMLLGVHLARGLGYLFPGRRPAQGAGNQ